MRFAGGVRNERIRGTKRLWRRRCCGARHARGALKPNLIPVITARVTSDAIVVARRAVLEATRLQSGRIYY